jgi:DNA-3-methyladenine glycosylase II
VRPETIALPPGYRRADLLAFHGRDAQGLAEQVMADRLRKGVLLDGVPVLFDIALSNEAARCRIETDAPLSKQGKALAREALQNMLGLRIDPAPFLKAVKKDPLLGAVARKNPGLRIMQSATIFEAITWAIIGQQINLPFAISLRRSFIELAGRAHTSGIWCYPEAGDVAKLEVDHLTSRKFSRAKAETLLRFAAMVARGELVLDARDDAAMVSAKLLAVKGIGPWTVNYALLRGYGYADCSLHGDVAIRNAFHRLLKTDAKPGIAETEALLLPYAPHRTMAAAHLWASLSFETA